MAKMLASAHRHNGGCGRRRHCCKNTNYMRKWHPLASIRKAQRAWEKKIWMKEEKIR